MTNNLQKIKFLIAHSTPSDTLSLGQIKKHYFNYLPLKLQ